MEAFLIFLSIGIIFFLVYKGYQKIKNKRWFKMFIYYLKVIPLSLILIVIAYFFLKDVYAYLFYPSYMAKIVDYEEYNSTNKDDVAIQNHSAVYCLKINGKKITIEEGGYAEGKLRVIGSDVEVLYRDEEIVEYNLTNLLFSFLGTMVASIFIFLHIRKEEFPDNLVVSLNFNEDEIIEEEDDG